MQNSKTVLSMYYEELQENSGKLAICEDDESISYKKLESRSSILAQNLIKSGITIEEPVGIFLPRGIDYIVALLGILKSGGCFVPLDSRYPQERLLRVISDTGMKFIVSNEEFQDKLQAKNIRYLHCNEFIAKEDEEYIFPEIKPENLAYIIYTSGSTGNPKGIEIEHRNVVNMLESYKDNFEIQAGMKATQSAAAGFDASLWEILPAICFKFSLYIITDEMLLDISQLTKFIRIKKIENIFLSTPVAEVFLESDYEGLNCLKYLTVGGDRLHKRPPADFPAKLINVYGPAECCIMVTQKEVEPSNPDHSLPAIGKPIGNTNIHILDKNGRPVKAGETGEIYISGANVGRGYKNLPDDTKSSFLKGRKLGINSERVYRTGDIGKQYANGDYVCLGRTDFQVKIRGQRIELAEIENALDETGIINQNTVRIKQMPNGEKKLIAWIIASRNITQEEINGLAAKKLPAYMLPEQYIFLDNFPLTINGKIDYDALPMPDISYKGEMVKPETHTEEKLLDIWQKVLGLKTISTNDDFLAVGGHSLTAGQMMVRIRKELDVEVTIQELLRHRTIKAQGMLIGDKSTQKKIDRISVQPEREYYPLSLEQEELWIIHNLDKTGITHNIVLRLDLWGWLDKNIFNKALQSIINKHIMLRAGITEIEGKPVFHESHDIDSHLDIEKVKNPTAVTQIIDDLSATDFDLSNAPLFKHKLLQTADTHFLYLMCIHHLITDGWSMGIFVRELGEEYRRILKKEKDISEKVPDYQDYVIWERKNKLNADLEWWQKKLIPRPQPTFLKSAKLRENLQHFLGKRIWFWLDAKLTQKLKDFALDNNITLFSAMLSIFKLAVMQETGRSQIAVGTPYANRNELELESIFGYFTNMVTLYSDIDPEKSIAETAKQENEVCLEAFAHSESTFGKVVDKLGYKYNERLHPIFQMLFIFQNYPFPDELLPEIKFDFTELGNKTTNIDLTCNVTEKSGQLECWLMYQTELYDEKEIIRLQKSYLRLLDKVTENCHAPVKDLIKVKEYPENSCWLFGRTGLLQICGESLQENGFLIKGIISNDKKIISWAKENTLPCYPENTELLTLLSDSPFDYLFSIINEVIIPGEIYRLARKAAINFHDSPLPRYAGMYATTWAILNGEKEHGVSWHLIKEKIDAGDILVQKLVTVADGDTAASLNARCFSTAIIAFKELLAKLKSSRLSFKRQDLNKRTYFGYYKRPGAVISIDVYNSAEEIERAVRALTFADQDNELGIAKIYHDGNFFLINKLESLKQDSKHPAGTILEAKDQLKVQTASGIILIGRLYAFTGKQIEISQYFKEHDRIAPLETEKISQLQKLYKSSQKSEPFWIDKLLHYRPLEIDACGDKKSRKFLKAEMTKYQDTAMFLIFIGLYFNQTKYSCIYRKNNYNNQFSLLSGSKPFEVNLKETYTLEYNLQQISNTMQEINGRTEYLRDLFIRNQVLQGFSFKDCVVLCNGDYQISGDELIIAETGNRLKSIRFNAARFSSEAVEQFVQHWFLFSKRYSEHLDLLVDNLELISDADKEFQLNSFNQTKCNYPLEKSYSQLFKEAAQLHADKIAVESAQGKITYIELAKSAQSVADEISLRMVKPVSVIAVCLPRSEILPAAVIGIFDTGCIYLPIDPDYPKSRIHFMLKDSDSQIALVNNETAAILQDANIELVNLDELKPSTHTQPANYSRSSQPAYMIYTSGTTGKPKGVLISQRSLINHCFGAIDIYGISSSDRVLQFSSLSFDISIEEMFPCLLAGASLIFRNEEAKLSAQGFWKFVNEHKISIVDLPTAFWHGLTDEIGKYSIPSSLRVVIAGGEKVKLSQFNKWQSLTSRKVDFYNTYGPTETTVIASTCKGKENNNWKEFPIGKPVPNCQLYIMDSRKKLRPRGLSGELFIGGEGVALGYLNRKEATQSAFPLNPYTQTKVYKSGDLVRFNSENELEYLGRIDNQLKISGFRIEPEEISRVLESYHSIKQAYVDIFRKKDIKFLTAWVQAENINYQELEEHLSKLLPDFMIPKKIVALHKLPLNPNGKIDINALPAPSDEDSGKEYKEPYNEFQRLLCRLFQDILNLSQVGIKDNFFRLGGNSLLAMKLIGHVQNAGMELSINDLFNHEDIEDLSLKITYKSSEEKSVTDFSLVQIQKSSRDYLPLIICHLSPGDLLGYSALFQEIAPGIPVYGLQTPTLMDSKLSFDSISELAAWYIDILDRKFGNTEYVLFGHCFGGALAYEITRQLEMQERSPSKLIISETWLMPPTSGIAKWHYGLHKIKNIFRMNPLDFLYYVRVKFFHHNPVSPFVEIKEEGKDNPLFLRRVELQNKHLKQFFNYRYKPLKQHINIFVATNYPRGLIPDPTLGWNVITKRYSIYRFKSSHGNLLWKPAVKDMADTLKDLCQRRK